jgi:hypothetical protein
MAAGGENNPEMGCIETYSCHVMGPVARALVLDVNLNKAVASATPSALGIALY